MLARVATHENVNPGMIVHAGRQLCRVVIDGEAEQRRIDLECPDQVEPPLATEKLPVVLLDHAVLGLGQVLVQLNVEVVHQDVVDEAKPRLNVVTLLLRRRPAAIQVDIGIERVQRVVVVLFPPGPPQHVVAMKVGIAQVGAGWRNAM